MAAKGQRGEKQGRVREEKMWDRDMQREGEEKRKRKSESGDGWRGEG